MKVAIDVVLLPSTEMTEKVIQINRELSKINDNKIVFGKDCLPHISLCMGVIEGGCLPIIQEMLQALAEELQPFELVAEKLRADVIPTGETMSGIRIRKDMRLGELQNKIMTKLWPHLSYDRLDAQMFYHPNEIEDITFTWVKNYAKKHSDSSLFHPHITVGSGKIEVFDTEFPMAFSGSALVLCQLGNYCTARKVYMKFELGG